MESPVATRTVCSPTRFPWKAGHAARSILSRLGDAPSRGVNRLYVAADVRIDFGTLIRACSRTTLLPPVGQGGTGRCCMASRARDRAPFSMNDDVHVGSRHAGRDRGFWEHLEAAGWPALPSPGGCNLLLRLPETFLPMSLWCRNIRVLDLLPLNCLINV